MTSNSVVEKVRDAIEHHFVSRFGAKVVSDGPSHLVRCLAQTAFNPANVAQAAIAAMEDGWRDDTRARILAMLGGVRDEMGADEVATIQRFAKRFSPPPPEIEASAAALREGLPG